LAHVLQRYLTNVSALQIYQLFRYGAVVVTAIILTKTSLTQEQIGLFETFLLLAGAVSFFWTSGIIHATLSSYPKQAEAERPKLLFQVFLLLLGMSAVFSFLLYILAEPVNHFLITEAGMYPFYYPLLLFLLFHVPSFLSEHILLLKNDYKAIIYYGAIVLIGQVGFSVLPVWAGYGLQGAISGLVVFSGLRFIYLLYLVSKHAEWQFSWPTLSSQAMLAAPLAGSFFLSGSAEYIDGIIVRHFFDSADFALFRYGARELPLSLLLANAFSAATVPSVAEDKQKAMARIHQSSQSLMHLLFPLSIILAIASPWLFPIVFNASFSESAYIFNIYLLLVITRLLFPQTLLIGMQQNGWLLTSSGIELVLNVGLSLLLLKWAGLYGIAIATIVAFFFDKMFLMSVVSFRYGIRPGQYVPIFPYLSYSLLLLIVIGASFYFSL